MLFLKIKAVFIQQYDMLLQTTQQNYICTVRRVWIKGFHVLFKDNGRKCKNSLWFIPAIQPLGDVLYPHDTYLDLQPYRFIGHLFYETDKEIVLWLPLLGGDVRLFGTHVLRQKVMTLLLYKTPLPTNTMFSTKFPITHLTIQ